LQILVYTTSLGNLAQDFARNHDGGLAAKFYYFADGVRTPSAQPLDHNISILVAVLRHNSRNPRLPDYLIQSNAPFFQR